jgi:hypothetical protein
MTPESATLLAEWLGETHPDIFAQVYAEAVKAGVNARPVRSLGSLGDDGDPTMADVGIDDNSALTSIDTGTIGEGTSFWDSVGSTLSTVGSGILNAAASVGNYLTSAQGLNTLANVGTAVLKTQQAQAVATTQQAVLQQQIVRAQTGIAPAPITYQNGLPVYSTGQLDGGIDSGTLPPSLLAAIQNGTAIPVQLPDGTIGYELTNSSTLNSVLGGSTIPSWLWIAGGALLLIAVL